MTVHVPVLPNEVIEQLAPAAGATVVDGTMGGGGHTRMLAELVGMTGRVIGLDRDAAAVDEATNVLKGLPVMVCQSNYADLPEVLEEIGIEKVNGILLDLGLSSDQLEDRERGFSFDSEGPLDLRFDTTAGRPAWQMIERLSAEHLADLIYNYGEERCSRRIARRIVETRRENPIKTAKQLAELVRRSVPRDYEARIHPATRTFQALRIAANEELKWLDVALERLPDCLELGGRLAIISFHSLEDRRVKIAFREDDRLRALTAKPIIPTDTEIATNPRSRSAKLRVAERCDAETNP